MMISSTQHNYDPGQLLTALQNQLNVHSDAALSKVLNISRGLINQIRQRRRPVGGAVLIRMHEVSRLSVADLRGLMGDRRRKCRMPVRLNLQKPWPHAAQYHSKNCSGNDCTVPCQFKAARQMNDANKSLHASKSASSSDYAV